MEFPNLGGRCNEKSCQKLDFLPIKCDSCRCTFCSFHFHSEQHTCKSTAKHKDYKVPLCPLCGEPVPTSPNTSPDITVSQHIDRLCKTQTSKIFTNCCSYENCKRKELIPLQCVQCKRNYCLRHRHCADHKCQVGQVEKPSNSTTNGSRKQSILKDRTIDEMKSPQVTRVRNNSQIISLQGFLDEDEALSYAIAQSMEDFHQNNVPPLVTAANNENDAHETAESTAERDQPSNTRNKNKCMLS